MGFENFRVSLQHVGMQVTGSCLVLSIRNHDQDLMNLNLNLILVVGIIDSYMPKKKTKGMEEWGVLKKTIESLIRTVFK